VTESRALFPKAVRDPGQGERLLKSAKGSAKIGGLILKGWWAGFPAYTLTLEERATCPSTCFHWSSCFGNNSPFARRFRHGPALEAQLEREVADLARQHPRGFAVRLHNLGDFYSVGYVDLWHRLLARHRALHVWGYTARHDVANDPIAARLAPLSAQAWPRFAVRFSDGPMTERSTISISNPSECPPDAIICPEQTGKTDSCSECGLCWTSVRRIAFLAH
jgi:hypothetical protein